MLRSMYSGVSGLKAQQTKMDVIGNNLANVSTVGFKRGDVFFQDMMNQNLGSQNNSPFNREIGLGVQVGAVGVDFGQGAAQTTGRNTDFMIQGEGMFVVVPASAVDNPATANGLLTGADNINNLQFTRDGIFEWDNNGFLRTMNGDYVVGSDGQLITREATVDNPDGAVEIQSILATAIFSNYNGLSREGGNNYSANGSSGQATFNEGAGRIVSGAVEVSNVDLGTEFTNMIITSRAFQANSRTISTSDEMLQELVNLKR